MPQTEAQLRRARRLIIALSVLSLLLISLTVFTYVSAQHLRGTIYERCSARENYDSKVQDAFGGLIAEKSAEINQEENNRFIDDTLREWRISTKRASIAKLRAAQNAALPKGGCEAYRPTNLAKN